MADFTLTQGRYLAFIQAYTDLHGYPPAEAEIAAALCVSPPSVNQMVKAMEKKGLILRQPGRPRALQVLVPADEVPPWGSCKPASRSNPTKKKPPAPRPVYPPAALYTFKVFITAGPMAAKYANKVISRVIEIRGDQTLDELHHAIFEAYDRWDQHLYEFQFGKHPFDPQGPTYGLPGPANRGAKSGDAQTTKLDDLKLTPGRCFGYWFDFGDDWFHQVQVEKIDQAIPTVKYPRIANRVGKSPPQYPRE